MRPCPPARRARSASGRPTTGTARCSATGERPDATAETLAGGELHTGDIGLLDETGRLHVRDRKSLVILRGGANVYPAEVERVLLDHPDVDAGAVLGVPDERLGERVAAVVEAAAGTEVDVDDVRAHLLANLARYKVPEQITVVAALPRNAMGKIVRTELPALVDPAGSAGPAG